VKKKLSAAQIVMADEFQRSKLYQYRENSNLVLEADREVRRRVDEATGEVETLHGKLGSVRMGDRLDRENHEDLSDRIRKAHSKRQLDDTQEHQEKKRKKESKVVNVISETEILDSVNYRPKTRESRASYEEILNFIQICLGDQPQDILLGAADEVLSILKDHTLRDPERQREIEKIISKISSEKFNKLVNLGKKITDFSSTGDSQQTDSKLDEDMGVAVVFEDDEDEVNEDLSEVHDSEDDDDIGVDVGDGKQLKGGDDNAGDIDIDQQSLSVHDIDAHWLQRQLSKYYTDANVSAKLSEDTLNALQITDGRDCENQLVVLLDYDKFDFIKLLLRNRWKIFYCTKLKQAQTDTERTEIELEMKEDGEGIGNAILEEINQTATAESWAADRLGEFANKARREARALNRSGKENQSSDEIEENIGNVSLLKGKGATGVENLIDLDSLHFNQGGHLMANNRCELPEKSWRAQKKGYEEVHVPAIRPIISSKEKLVHVADLPEWCQPAFSGVKSLNRIQSRMVDAAMYGSDNILLCAPTGAGKTNVALMCMLSVINRYRHDDGIIDLDSFKIVYVAPMKALVQEVVQNFSKKLAPFGMNVKELSGDQNLTRQQIQDTHLIVTTPEKWDIITRKAGDRAYTQLVKLVIIDEIHLLHDDRGPVLESLVARTIRQIEVTHEMVRMVGLSATLPNFEDVATFLRVDPEKGLFFFDNSFRPVPLQQQYIGVTEKKALKRFQLMNEICYEKVLQHAGRNQVLIFTHSRAETAKTAKALRDMALENDVLSQFVRDESASKEILREEAGGAKNADLKDLLPFGFAIHHAGMVRSDRTLVEDLFSDKHIQVLVSTATLAWGVNLPAHTVILKGTQMYSPEQGRWVELSPLDIMQMMGRAGRYGLDSEGEGIIITAHSELQYYLSLMNQQLPIESQFIKKLPDMLNAEIVLGTVQSIKEAAIWLSYTYLFIRMLRNPSLYGITNDEMKSDPILMQRRIDLAHSAAVVLDRHNLIRYDRKTGMFQVTALGRVASHYYVSHESISVFNEYLKPTLSEIEIFRLFSLSGEFKFIHVREEEKLELVKLLSRVPIPVKEGVDEPSAKINVLLQAYISRLKLEVGSMFDFLLSRIGLCTCR
jgi:pre-mRNA-splicing helicase BRR2